MSVYPLHVGFWRGFGGKRLKRLTPNQHHQRFYKSVEDWNHSYDVVAEHKLKRLHAEIRQMGEQSKKQSKSKSK